MSGPEKILEEIDDLIIHSAWPCLNLVEKRESGGNHPGAHGWEG